MLDSALRSIWDDVVFYVTFAWADPFWSWLLVLIVLYAAVMLICYFFGTYWPVLRVIGGVMLLIATFGLFAYAKGESDARAHDRKKYDG